MKRLIIPCILLGLCQVGFAQPPCVKAVKPTEADCPMPGCSMPGCSISAIHDPALFVPTSGADEKVDHLLQAAAHLEAAGENERARQVRLLADKETRLLLDRLHALEAEVARLRQKIGPQPQVMVKVQMVELSRTKLKAAGFDFAKLHGPGVKDNAAIHRTIESLQKDGLIKVLAAPTVVTMSGRPAMFKCGGEFPISLPSADGSEPARYQDYGTEVNLLPTVLGDNKIRLEISTKFSELDPDLAVTTGEHTFPGVSVRQSNTVVELKTGQTIVLGGLVQVRETGEKGSQKKETFELIVLATPQIVEPMHHRTARPAPPHPIRTVVRPAAPRQPLHSAPIPR